MKEASSQAPLYRDSKSFNVPLAVFSEYSHTSRNLSTRMRLERDMMIVERSTCNATETDIPHLHAFLDSVPPCPSFTLECSDSRFKINPGPRSAEQAEEKMIGHRVLVNSTTNTYGSLQRRMRSPGVVLLASSVSNVSETIETVTPRLTLQE